LATGSVNARWSAVLRNQLPKNRFSATGSVNTSWVTHWRNELRKTGDCGGARGAGSLPGAMGSLIKKRRKRMRKKKHKKMLKRTRFQRRNK
jgi:hypothetical protein